MTPLVPDVTDGWTLGVIAGLTVVTVLTRCLFFISSRPWQLPHWVHRALQYAPIAALSAVVLPEIVMRHGQFIQSLHDARLYGAAAGVAYYVVSRGKGQAVLGTIVSGMLVYLPLHMGLGW